MAQKYKNGNEVVRAWKFTGVKNLQSSSPEWIRNELRVGVDNGIAVAIQGIELRPLEINDWIVLHDDNRLSIVKSKDFHYNACI